MTGRIAMKKAAIAAAFVALGLGLASAPASADPGAFEWLMKQVDQNKDGVVTRQEFLDAMGKAYDRSMAKMKNDAAMVKGNAMTMDGVTALLKEIYKGA
jgi:Ca2+-binding EF-hand superfamily protein